MSRDAEAKNLRLYDRRTIERNIKKGLITRKDYEKFLKALDDAKDKGVMGTEIPEADDDLDDADDAVVAEGAEADNDEGEDEADDEAAETEPSPTGSNSH
jgi:hypothetical protein